MNQDGNEKRVEKFYHSNGQISTEIPYQGEHTEGTVKKWYENGQIKSELPKRQSVNHGMYRQWNEEGKLLDESEFINGTGLFRSYYEDGTLEGEVQYIDNAIHGYIKCWDEAGELVTTKYFIKGGPVSRKKYEQEYGKQADELSADEILIEQLNKKARAKHKPNVVDFDKEEEFKQKLLSSGESREALSWLKQGVGYLGEYYSNEDSIQLIEDLYNAGAIEVLAVEIDMEDDYENTGKLLIELGSKKSKRKKVLNICNPITVEQGFDEIQDDGQKYVFVMLD